MRVGPTWLVGTVHLDRRQVHCTMNERMACGAKRHRLREGRVRTPAGDLGKSEPAVSLVDRRERRRPTGGGILRPPGRVSCARTLLTAPGAYCNVQTGTDQAAYRLGGRLQALH